MVAQKVDIAKKDGSNISISKINKPSPATETGIPWKLIDLDARHFHPGHRRHSSPSESASTSLVQRDTCRVTLCASPDQMHKSGASGLEVYKCHHGASPDLKSAHTYSEDIYANTQHHRLTTVFKDDPTGSCVFGRTWRKPLVRTKDRMTAGRETTALFRSPVWDLKTWESGTSLSGVIAFVRQSSKRH